LVDFTFTCEPYAACKVAKSLTGGFLVDFTFTCEPYAKDTGEWCGASCILNL